MKLYKIFTECSIGTYLSCFSIDSLVGLNCLFVFGIHQSYIIAECMWVFNIKL